MGRDRFVVYEDGQVQEIRLFKHEEVPLTLGLVIDSSASMRGKRSETIAAVLALVRSLNPEDEIFIVNFNDDAELGLRSDRGFTNDLEQVRTALTLEACSGRTALYDAIGLALDQLQQGHHEKKALLLISDGGDNASHLPLQQVIRKVKKSRVVIYAINLSNSESREQNPKVLKQIARISGGEFYAPSSLKEIETICQEISQEIRSQYTLGYVPSNQARDGTFRKIQVKLSGSRDNYSVRTREGYLAPGDELKSPGSH